VAAQSPENLAKIKESYTGQFLQKILNYSWKELLY
jgi:excinuclease UvrABC ATPase subunit